MLTIKDLRSCAARCIEEAKALPHADPEFARLVKLAESATRIADEWESQDEMIAQVEHDLPDEADAPGFWPEWIWNSPPTEGEKR
jgi:hypothetical protein